MIPVLAAAGLAAVLPAVAIAAVITAAAGAPTPTVGLALRGQGTCLPGTAGDPNVAAVVPNLDPEQTAVARTIVEVGGRLGVPARGLQVAIVTGMQESGLRPLSYGDRDSLGVFQQRAPWGPAEDRLDPARSAQMFFTGGRGGQPGLLAVPGWQLMPLWEAAQTVQRSAFPRAYERWETLAEQIVPRLSGLPGAPVDCQDGDGQEAGQATAAIPCTIGGTGEVWPAPGGVQIRVCSVGPFAVDTTIAPAVAALLAQATRDGILLGGSGGRSNARQQELRSANCGGPANIFNPAAACSPPTAVPGRSQHEWALALDLTCDGGSAFAFGSSRCFPWMVRNAANYGLRNLPSEGWHWSTTGR